MIKQWSRRYHKKETKCNSIFLFLFVEIHEPKKQSRERKEKCYITGHDSFAYIVRIPSEGEVQNWTIGNCCF